MATILRTGLVIISYGCKVPAGIFVPSMAIGASFGPPIPAGHQLGVDYVGGGLNADRRPALNNPQVIDFVDEFKWVRGRSGRGVAERPRTTLYGRF